MKLNKPCVFKISGNDTKSAQKILIQQDALQPKRKNKKNVYISPFIIHIIILIFCALIFFEFQDVEKIKSSLFQQQSQSQFQINGILNIDLIDGEINIKNVGLYQIIIFTKIWCLLQILAILINSYNQVKFYNWFYNSGISDSNNRGLSTKGYPLFGFIKIPNILPKDFPLIIFFFVISLSLTCFGPITLFKFTVISNLLLGIIYFSQIWAERSGSYHRECMSIVILFYLAFNPDFYGLFKNQKNRAYLFLTQSYSCLIMILIKIHLITIYLGSVIQKGFLSIVQRSFWHQYTPYTLIWLASWSKPFYPKLQDFLLRNPYFVQVSGFFTFIFEGMFGLQLIIQDNTMQYTIQILMSLGLMSFHLGVFFIQGIDYITFWNPVFIIYFFRAGNFLNCEELINLYKQILEFQVQKEQVQINELIYILPALFFCSFQILYCFTFLEDFNFNIPPFTCCPMFVYINKIKSNKPQFYILQDPNQSISYENLEWMQPFFKYDFGLGVQEQDYGKIPFKFIGFGCFYSLNSKSKIFQHLFTRELLEKEGFFVYSNFPISESLVQDLQNIVNILHSKDICDQWNWKELKYNEIQYLIQQKNQIYRKFINEIQQSEEESSVQ